ncbi:TPA: DUF4928 family protein [Escherichia coli]
MKTSIINGSEVSRLSVAIQAETFIGNNIEEIAIYDGDEIRESLARLIHLL